MSSFSFIYSRVRGCDGASIVSQHKQRENRCACSVPNLTSAPMLPGVHLRAAARVLSDGNLPWHVIYVLRSCQKSYSDVAKKCSCSQPRFTMHLSGAEPSHVHQLHVSRHACIILPLKTLDDERHFTDGSELDPRALPRGHAVIMCAHMAQS